MLPSNTAASKSPVPPIPLTNCQRTENIIFDTLYSKSIKEEATCCNAVCQGSVLQPKVKRNAPIDPNSVNIAEAEDFYSQYFSAHNTGEIHRVRRWNEVITSIKERNEYDMTLDELDFACKTSWRNAPRCIGRIQWSKLTLYDGRNVKSTKEMFDLICGHIEYGTNNGNIRSAIAVFPSRQSGVECRIWNSEYISYAGFEVSPGVVVGDPNHMEFTKICLQLGWNPPITRFQVLPLVLQFGDNNPDMYTIPPSLVLEVPLTHPKYPKFDELGLKWFAVPAVSNMSMDCGGQVYTATGFNGWYMSTEIVRNLCDINRYNLLKEIATSMHMDTSKPALFWKDFAAIELNVAVITSFQAISVTITDHHTASETFMHHLENEQMLRGGCPADWVWITPPLGGSLTPVFHQEMLNYKLKPSYEYQKNAWIGFDWKDELGKGIVRKKRTTLKCVVRAMVVCFKMMKVALRERKHCTILYATETGNSESYANKLRGVFAQDLHVELMCMDKYDMTKLKYEALLFIVTSTFGNGEAPDNGKEFEHLLTNLVERGNFRLSAIQPQFSVFGLGSSTYPSYCSFAERVDELLDTLGFNRLLELHTGDDQKDQQSAFKDWCNKAYTKTCAYFGTQIRSEAIKGIADRSHDYTLIPNSQSVPVDKGLRDIHKKPISMCQGVSVESLLGSEETCDTVLVKLQHDLLTYEPGDHLAIFPNSNEEKVKRLCASCIFDEGVDAHTPVSIGSNNLGGRIPVCSLSTALTHYLDIESTPKQSDIESLLPICSCEEDERETLLELSKHTEDYNEWSESKPSWVDFITDFPSLRIPAGFLFSTVPIVQPRYYSISSSPLVYPNQTHLTIGVLEYSAGQADRQQKKFGHCSNLLKNMAEGDGIHVFIRRCPSFHLPTYISHDIIMIGAGSGIAPFRSFWQHRAQLPKDPGAGLIYLFQGCRTKSSLLHNDEINQAVSDGVIEAQFTAFSREKNSAKTYVQDKLKEHAELLRDLLLKRNAQVYVCGDIQMAIGVAKTISSIIYGATRKRSLQMSPSIDCEGNLDYLEFMKDKGRYHEDIYSILV